MKAALNEVPVGYKKAELKWGPYSPSRLLIARCPARFQSKYIFKDKIVSDTMATSRGSAIHEVLQKITEYKVRKESFSPQLLNSWVSEAVGKYPASYSQVQMIKDAAAAYAGNPSPYINENTKCEIPMAVSFYEEESFMDDVVLSTAYVKTPYFDEHGRQTPGFYLGVKVDQMNVDEEIQTVTILDHKSTPSASANADHYFQMGCYAFMASLFYPGYRIRTVIHYAHPNLNFYAVPTEWEAEDLEDIEEEIRTRIQAIESFSEFPSLPGNQCDYCHMVQNCPDLRAVQEQNARGDINLNISNQEDMQRVARQVRVTGVLYDQLNARLKEAIETHCPSSGIAIDGMWVGFKTGDEKVDWIATDRKIREAAQKDPSKPKSLEAILKQHGLDSDAFKEWKGDKLRSLMRFQKDDLINILKEYFVTERSTRFGMYKN